MPEFKPFYDTSYALVMGIDEYTCMPPLSAAVCGDSESLSTDPQ